MVDVHLATDKATSRPCQVLMMICASRFLEPLCGLTCAGFCYLSDLRWVLLPL